MRFRYLVQEPTRLEVRILGPVPRDPSAPPPPTVRRLSFDYPDPAPTPASFVWDGRDDQGQLVTDGRYTVLLNDLPLRVDVDATPPDIAYGYSDFHSGATIAGGFGCQRGILEADRSWHVVDPHLKRHSLGSEEAYEFERDAAGQIIYDQGVPRPLRRHGRVVDRIRHLRFDAPARGFNDPEVILGEFEAEDYAGNRSVVPIPSFEDRLFLLTAQEGGLARNTCAPEVGIVPPIGAQTPPLTYAFRPLMEFWLYDPFEGAPLVFQYRLAGQTAWAQTPVARIGPDDDYDESRTVRTWVVDLIARGFDPGQKYDGRFTVTGPRGTLYSEEFSFRFCDAALSGGFNKSHEKIPGTDLTRYFVASTVAIPEPIASVTVNVRGRWEIDGFRASVPMRWNSYLKVYEAIVVAPNVDAELYCADPHPRRVLEFELMVRGESGEIYWHRRPGGVCGQDRWAIPQCDCGVVLFQESESCSEASPDHVRLVTLPASHFPDAIFRLERGPEDDPILLFEGPAFLPRDSPPIELTLDTTGFPEGDFGVRGRVIRLDPPPQTPPVCARRDIPVRIDRSPPLVDVLQPAEGGTLCVAADPPAAGKRCACSST